MHIDYYRYFHRMELLSCFGKSTMHESIRQYSLDNYKAFFQLAFECKPPSEGSITPLESNLNPPAAVAFLQRNCNSLCGALFNCVEHIALASVGSD
jgi:hypothetical protein